MQLTQLNSAQPISAKQVSRVFVPSAALWCVIYQPATFISWELFSSAAAYFRWSLKAFVDMSYKQACFSIILLTFLQILHSKIESPGKHVIYDVMTYKLSQLGHDVHNWSVTVVHAVNVSTTRRRVELSCVAINQSINQSINQKRIRLTKVTNVTARPLLQC